MIKPHEETVFDVLLRDLEGFDVDTKKCDVYRSAESTDGREHRSHIAPRGYFRRQNGTDGRFVDCARNDRAADHQAM